MLPFVAASPVGFDYNASTKTYHLWNDVEPYDYYINTTNGLQLANNQEAPWETVALCPYAMSGSTKATYCTDSLPFTWKAVTDNATYVNLTGTYRVLTTSSFKPQFNFTYHLRLKEPYIHRQFITKNLGTSSSAGSVGVVWVSKKVNIGGTTTDDYFGADVDYYALNSSFNYSNSSLAFKEYFLTDYVTGENIKVAWTNKNYVLNASSNGTQANASVLLDQSIGTLTAGQTSVVENTWVDALCNWHCYATFPSGTTTITLYNNYVQEGGIQYDSGTCPSSGKVYQQYNTGAGWQNISYSTSGVDMLDAYFNPYTGSLDELNQIDGYWVNTGNAEGTYATREYCVYNGVSSANGGNITVTTPTMFSCPNFIPLGVSTTLTASNTSCFNVTANNVVLDCANYQLMGNRAHGQYAVNVTGFTGLVMKNCYVKNYTNGVLLANASNATLINNTFFNLSDFHWTDLQSYGVNIINSSDVSLQINNFTNLWTKPSQTANCFTSNYLSAISADSSSHNVSVVNGTFDRIGGIVTSDGNDLAGCQPTQTSFGYGFQSAGDNVSVNGSVFSNTRQNLYLTGVNSNLSFSRFTGNVSYVTGDNSSITSNNWTNSRVSSALADNVYFYNNSFQLLTGASTCYLTQQNSINATIEYNLFRNCKGITSEGAYSRIDHNVFSDVKVTQTGKGGILVIRSGDYQNATNNTFYNITGSGGLFAVVSVDNGASNANLTYFNISNISDILTLYPYLASNLWIAHSTLANSSRPFMYSAASTNTQLHNVSFQGSITVYYNDTDEISVWQYARVNVSNQSWKPEENAQVYANLSNGSNVIDEVTDADGLTSWKEFVVFNQTGNATEPCTDQTYKKCFTPHNVSAYKAGYTSNSTNFTLSTLTAMQTWLVLISVPSGGDTPPQFGTIYFVQLWQQGFLQNYTIAVTDDSALSTCIFSFNANGTYVNETPLSLLGTASNCTMNKSIPFPSNATWVVWANDSANAFSVSSESIVRIVSAGPDLNVYGYLAVTIAGGALAYATYRRITRR